MSGPNRRRRRLQNGRNVEEIATASKNLAGGYEILWTAPRGNQRTIKPYQKDADVPVDLKMMADESPASFYSLLVPDEFFEAIADFTNLFAETKLDKLRDSASKLEINEWTPTNYSEIQNLFGLIMFMGIVKLPRLSDYWSDDDSILHHPFPRTIMTWERFSMLIKMLYIPIDDHNNELKQSKINFKLLDALNSNFKENYNPDEDLYIRKGDNINRGKKHKESFKRNDKRLFKLCSAPGYVYKVGLFVRKSDETVNETLSKTLYSLVSDCFEKGHTLYTEDCFTDLDLARKLLKNETHLVGYLKNNRTGLPMEVTSAIIDTGNYIARESHDGITVMKMRHKGETILLLSTKHSTQFVTKCTNNDREISKPHILVDYEKAKQALKLCGKVTQSSSNLFDSLKWYKKVAIDLLLNTAVVNALTLYKLVTKNSVTIVEFRKQLIKYLCSIENIVVKVELEIEGTEFVEEIRHRFARKAGAVRQNRRTCQQCYRDKKEEMGTQLAKNRAPKVITYCEDCPNKPHLCVTCFSKIHG